MIAVAAMSENRVIGRDGKIPWHLPEDFKWFKRLTIGGVILMGRKTYESIGAKPLPQRMNVVLSRTANFPEVTVVRSLEELDTSALDCEIFVIGGAEIYRQLLPLCTDLYLTVVKREVEGDTLFPEFEDRFIKIAVVLDDPDFEVRHYRNRDMLLA